MVPGYNPVAIARVPEDGAAAIAASPRIVVTVAGTTGYDASFRLVPVTEASVTVYDVPTSRLLGTFRLGLVGLAGTRPAIGRDAVGHLVGYFPSAVTGEVYLLLLDGLVGPFVDDTRLAVLRGPENGIPILTERAGGPGANVTGVALAPDGRTLVVAGFGDLFAWPEPEPGRLVLIGLPEDVVTGSGFGTDFVPGVSLHGTVPGRALGRAIASITPQPDGSAPIGERPSIASWCTPAVAA
mgnify:CR=1 FL=1